MIRRAFIEAVRRQIYGGQPSSEAAITINLVNQYIEDAIGIAVKANYKDSIAVDGVAYINNSFYTTFKALPIVEDEQFLWKTTLPHIPLGLGTSEGVPTLVIKDYESRQISDNVVWLSQYQRSFARGMRSIPNKILAYSEGKYIYIMSTLILSEYTAQVTIVSGGSPTDLSSELNVPADYLPLMRDYLFQKFMSMRSVPQDVTNDGADFIKTT